MAPSVLTSLAMFAALSYLPLGLVVAKPLKMSSVVATDEVFGLFERQSCSSTTSYSVHYDSCNVCTPTDNGEGPPDCEQSCYYHNGATGFSCSDEACFFDPDNFCDVSENGQIVTPFGDGDWTVADGCSEDNDQGTYAGTIVQPNGGQDWACSCVNSAKGVNGANDCGQEYTCTEVWACGCTQCNN